MSLTREECEKSFKRMNGLILSSPFEGDLTDYNDLKKCGTQLQDNFMDDVQVFSQLIDEHFELEDALESYEEEINYLNAIIDVMADDIAKESEIFDKEEIKNRYSYHGAGRLSNIIDENKRLSSQVIEANRVAKNYKDHNIELMNYIAQIEREFKDNPALKFEELKPDMWVWDKKDNKYIHICKKRIYEYDIGCFYKGQKLLRIYCDSGWYDTPFIEGRFYEREVKS